MSRVVALTTTDNPYDPIDDYEQWYRYDSIEHSYGTQEYLDRVTHPVSEMGEEIYISDIEKEIDKAVELDLIGLLYEGVHYKKVVRE